MPIPVQCPACQSLRSVADAMAGATMRCACGAQVMVPRSAPPPAAGEQQIAVTCPQCGGTYGANPAQAGQTLACPCGNAVVVPQPAQGSLFDEVSLAPPERLGQSIVNSGAAMEIMDRSDEDADHELGSIYSYAIKQISRGVSPRRVYQVLVDHGVPADEAESVIMNAMPDRKLGSFVNRRKGWAHFRYGALTFVMGLVISALLVPLGLAIVTVVPIVGLFYMFYGLIMGVTGWE